MNKRHHAGALACLAALVGITMLELLQLPWMIFAEEPALGLGAVGACLALCAEYFTAPTLVCAVLAVANGWRHTLAASSRFVRVTSGVGTVFVCSYVSFHAYSTVAREQALSGNALIVGLFVVFGIGMALIVSSRGGLGWGRTVVTRLSFVFCSVAFLGGYAANSVLFKNQYPALHVGVLETSIVLAFLSALEVLDPSRDSETVVLPYRLRHWGLGLMAAAVLVASSMVTEVGEAARRYVIAHSNLGAAVSLYVRSFREPGVDVDDGKPVVVDDPETVFETYVGLPTLPENFALADYNVLVISAEATRYDQTSLRHSRLGTTPNLDTYAEQSGTVMERAYASSSGTLQSMAAMMAMSHPSALNLSTHRKAWHGELAEAETTAAELFSASGYATFWVGHNYRGVFGDGIVGLGQGFNDKRLIVSEQDAVKTDESIAADAIQTIEKYAGQPEPFFGWVFFESPHWPYVQHATEDSGSSEFQRYKGELLYMDRQLGKVLEYLTESRLMENTIVVFHGDHGEEFGEHGGSKHKSTVYTESVHIPLVLWVPGLEARRVSTPTSLSYVFPWLMRSGAEPMRRHIEERIRNVVAPMMQATGGGVVSELVGHDRLLSTLIFEDAKVNYNFHAKLHETYNLKRDPGERTDLIRTHREWSAPLVGAMTRYRKIRAKLRQFSVWQSED